MKYTLHTHHIELTEADSALLDKKLDRLAKHLQPPFTASIGLRRDAHHRSGEIITCTANITHGGKTLHAERTANTIQDATDEVVQALLHELAKEHGKAKDKHDQY